MARITKKDIYKKHGIEFVRSGGQEYIITPEFGKMPKLLVDGNDKIGKGVWHFSTLPTNKSFAEVINGKEYTESGTCPCTCNGCYADNKGNYRYHSTKESLLYRTYLARHYTEWTKRAIIAQIEADKIKFIRIHASGDFFSNKYIAMWQEIARECRETIFWTYTKNKSAVNMFDGFENANIVKSIIKGYGFNFGHCDYILRVYKALREMGKDVYICRCGIDKDQHCTNCKGCSKNEFVLFIEHSTEYKAENDPLFPELKAIIESQPKP